MTLRQVLLGWLTVLSACAAIAAGFFVVSPAAGVAFVRYFGYFVILVAVLAFFIALWLAWRGCRFSWTKGDWRVAGLACVVGLVWQVQEPHGFKVLMDETVLAATSMSMHFDREVFTPLKTHEVDGVYLVVDGILDKRPLLFPFLVSVVHDLTGYRPENAFIVNGLLSVLLLYLAGRLGRILGGSDRAGYLTVLVLAGVPLLGLNATAGGFDLLNLTMVCVLGLLLIHYLRDRTSEAQDAIVMGAVLLAQTRYESAGYAVLAGVVVLYVWWRAGHAILSWSLPLAPVLLVTLPLQQRLLTMGPEYWKADLAGPPFSIAYFVPNVGHAVNFLFTWNGYRASAPMLAGVGGICLLLACVATIRRFRIAIEKPEQLTFLILAAGILANFGVVMCYFWGQLDDFVAARLALPLFLLFTLSIALIIGRKLRSSRWWSSSVILAVGWFWIWVVPFSAKAQGTNRVLRYQEVAWERSYAATRPGRVLFVMPSALPAIIERRAGVMTEMFAERAPEMAFHLAAGTYNETLIFQELQYDPLQKKYIADGENTLGPEFKLETLAERQFKRTYIERVSRLVSIDLSRAKPHPEDWQPMVRPFPVDPNPPRNPTEAYKRKFLENLP